MPSNDARIKRMLMLQHLLSKDLIINKKDFASGNSVNDKTVQRDISVLNCFYLELNGQTGENISIVYSREKQGYILKNENEIRLTKEQILASVKILLESRAFCKDEIDQLLDALILQVAKKEQKEIREIVSDEKFNYVPLSHNKPLLPLLYNVGESIRHCCKTELSYTKKTGEKVKRIVRPVSIIFSEYYFYLIAFRDDEDYGTPTIYRLDRIESITQTQEKFYIPYSSRFKDGEFRKRVQFMYSGELIKVKFEFIGETIEPVLERLPTAKILNQVRNKFTIEAEVYGTGIKMWLLSQGSRIRVLSPEALANEIKEEINKLHNLYEGQINNGQ